MKIEKYGLITGATALVFAAVAATGAGLHLPKGVALSENSPNELIDEVWQIVDKHYIDGTFNRKDWRAIRTEYLNKKHGSKKETYESIRLMLKNLNDPYTYFMSANVYRGVQIYTTGRGSGVGVELAQNEKTKKLEVIALIEDNSADKAGILPKDIITKIDGRSTTGLDLIQAVQLIVGKEDTSVKLTIHRDNRQTLEFNLVRRRFKLHPVEAKYRPRELNGIGYIRLKQFSVNAATEMRGAIGKLESQGAKGYVLDLRSNPGGSGTEAIEIARMWLDNGKIYSTVNRQGTGEVIWANRTAITKKPLVILVNGDSASASELLAGALQDNKRARLVGVKTFGKGVAQSIYKLPEGAAMMMTIAKYYPPSGKDINHVGIEPDVRVKLTEAQRSTLVKDRTKVATAADPQYVKALQVLRVAIANSRGSAQKRILK